MSKITPEITARLAVLEKQIRVDWKAFNDDFKNAMQRAEGAAVSGWQIGRALIEVKGLIPHGAFRVWYERFGVPERTGQRFMEKAREFPELKDFVANRREMFLSTGMLPDKTEIHHDGNIVFGSTTQNHQRFLNRWHHWFDEVKSGKLKYNETQVKDDLKPLYEWLKELYGE